MTAFTESEVEDAALEWLAGLGYAVARGPDIGPEGRAEPVNDIETPTVGNY